MKAEDILNKSAKKNMISWSEESFKKSHPRLYKTIIEAIEEALSACHSEQTHKPPVEESFYCYDKNVANAEEDYDFERCNKQCGYCKAV